MSVPIATNVGKAPVKVAETQTISYGPDGSAQEAPPVTIPKGALGKPNQVEAAAPGAIPKGKGTRVVMTYLEDGDTFKYQPVDPSQPVPNAGGTFTCRFDTIDAPETPHPNTPKGPKPGQAYGDYAKDTLKELIANKQLNIVVTGQAKSYDGKPGRDLCQVEVEGKNIDAELLKAGAAMIYEQYVKPGNPRKAELESAQASAQSQKRGIWQDAYPEKPWNFRNRINRRLNGY